ncbi:unconventional myosin-XVIIIa isoform X3 [Fopius arisanus]|uniref:Unconventional myosin-XVIIIa isoform X3 n=2 Tax=Fopius arisanus TaxID=64838 RepID=A0A9R1U570_9HYME|nr:PREDICTED: unconventional myosin-XVIIIa isoform X3 [Fopius arisanus]
MSSTKTLRMPPGQKLTPVQPQWSSYTSICVNRKLSKAKSSPNVSKLALTVAHTESPPVSRKPIGLGSKKSSPQGKQTRIATPLRSQNNVTIVEITGEPSSGYSHRNANKTPQRVIKKAINTTPSIQRRSKDGSCTILEDRALLKKGLTSSPEKLPNKSETLRKKSLNRSTSLWNVPADREHVKITRHSVGGKFEGKDRTRDGLNRATSLWSVPTDNSGNLARAKSINALRPSKIPLFTHHFGSQSHIGNSMGDLLIVDRFPDKFPDKSYTKIEDFRDEVDHASSEHIYQNCREAVGHCNSQNAPPIYENIQKQDKSRKELMRTVSVHTLEGPVSFLEARAAELMAQLDKDDDDNNDETMMSSPQGQNNEDLQKIKTEQTEPSEQAEQTEQTAQTEQTRKKELVKSRENLIGKMPTSPKGQDCFLGRQPEVNIQEIRKTWENQIKQSQHSDDADKKISDKQVNCPGKRTKDIEQLVNFFNCKNEKASKEAGTDNWKLKEPPIAIIPKKDEKANGYSSDGNCSEDSGHISNENYVEWKEDNSVDSKNIEKTESFLKGIIHDLDSSLERTIEAFDALPIVQRYVPEEPKGKRNLKRSGSNWEECQSVTTTKADSKITATGNTGDKIFFRAGALERLESQRDEKLTGHIILLQARCRGYLARRKLNTLKLQDLAVRCIQRNVRKLMSVREWPWWRLYVKVAPLLNVHRTEDQLKARTEELEVLRAKVEKLEQERNHLKHDNDKLEAKLSVMTADYAEEHSTSTLAAERIDAETSERLRLERELQDVTEAHKNLQQTTERLEMELLYARAADLNGIVSDGEDGEDGGVYKQRYEHAIRELEFIKRKMAQQHEDDLEQLVGLKKQLEKKLGDAYEEVEEQRQVVGQWKRRVQKLNGEMHDLRLLLEEQTARNNLLEKKQRKFDSETQNLIDDLRQEKAQRERLAREKEIAIAEKFTIEQNLSDAKLEIELQEERLHTLSQELEELTFGGKTEEEVAQLKKAKHELEKKCKDQEEELDDLAGQVQLLEQAKLRLEMSIEQQRKEMRKEMQQRDEELEDVRGNAHKKVKALEAQLENEHEERTILLREKHELERRLVAFEDQDRSDRAAEAETTQRLKRDLKRTRALLRDAQTMLERSKGDSTGKAALRQLKNQLEDAECARAVAVKAKQALEQELNETQAVLDEASKARSEAEERANVANRERTELISQLEENEEELAEVLKKYRAAVQQVSSEQSQLQEAQVQMSALEAEKSALKDQLMELSQRLESVEQLGDPTANSLATRRLEFRAKELESKLELEQTTRARVETQIARMKETVDKLQTETALLRTKEQTAQDAVRRLQRSLRELKDEASSATAREQEATRARRDLEKALDAAEAETKIARDDLRLALQRIDDLQSAIQGELDLDCSEEGTSENSDSD